MNTRVQVVAIRPTADETEVAVITSALSALWPEPSERSSILRDISWRFSGRTTLTRVRRESQS
jgi:hypothetical protein